MLNGGSMTEHSGGGLAGSHPENAPFQFLVAPATGSDFRLTPASIWRTDKPFHQKRLRGLGDSSTCEWALEAPIAVQGIAAGYSSCATDTPVGDDRL